MRSFAGRSSGAGTKSSPVMAWYSQMYRRDSSDTSSSGASGSTCRQCRAASNWRRSTNATGS